MKRFLIVVVALFAFSFGSMAQTPNNDTILANITNVDSPLYYPNLMLRYTAGDEMTAEEYHHLYYGYAFQPSYKPLDTNEAMNRVQNIMARLQIDTPSVSDIDELIAACIAATEHDPFSPTLLNILVYAYGTAGDKVREAAYARHLAGVLRCIEQSGDGLKERTPMHITMFSHGLDYMASKGIKYLKGRIISRAVEFVPFDFPRKRVKGYYFDYFFNDTATTEIYTFKRERTWQFNNLKPREYK